jgi:hypothetical protein
MRVENNRADKYPQLSLANMIYILSLKHAPRTVNIPDPFCEPNNKQNTTRTEGPTDSKH